MIKIGILSDTHLIRLNDHFLQAVDLCFADMDMIFHAGDLTDLSILQVFKGKEVHAVHGNMCHGSAKQALPTKKVVRVGNFSIGLMHGMGARYDVEDYLIREFDQVDCIISGHTHRPICHRLYDILFINPGSFNGTGYYGAPGTFATLEVGETLVGSIHTVPAFVRH